MICPSCQSANPDVARFCMQCGQRLPIRCPSCHTELPPEAKFCFNCGERLANSDGNPFQQTSTETIQPPQSTTGEQPKNQVSDIQSSFSPAVTLIEQRKLVSVLFADLVGFTSMSEKLDPEDVRELQQAYFGAVSPAITQQGGIVEKYVGDAVMAVFGLPQTQEDDPERAVRSALLMQDELARLNTRLEAAGQPLLVMRVGVNTGPVLAMYHHAGDFTVTGDTVNLASRLQSNAPPGGVLISNDTYRHVRGIFDVEELPPIQVKGKVEPVQVLEVRRVKPRALRKGLRSIEGIDTRLVGRQLEMNRLTDAFHSINKQAGLQFITIVAEAGLGKSRLLYELDIWSEIQADQFYFFSGRANPVSQNIPYSLFRDIFSSRFSITDSDSAEIVWQKIETGIANAFAGNFEYTPDNILQVEPAVEVRAHFIGALIGYDFHASPHLESVYGGSSRQGDPQQLHDRGLSYLFEYFQVLSERLPILVLLDDIQWADDSSLDALDYLARRMEIQPMLIVAAARPNLFERRQHWGEGRSYHSKLTVPPLSRSDTQHLIDEIFQKADQVPESLRERIVANAEGNPLYMEELVKMLVERGVVKPGEDRWDIDLTNLEKVETPPTLAALLQARIDQLPIEERMTASRAAVIGRLFWDQAVAYLRDPIVLPLEATRHDLDSLRRREIIFSREQSSFSGTQEYIFKGSLLREAVYENILKRERRSYHALVAEWLRAHAGERAGELIGQIADHLALAGQAKEASNYLELAGTQAAAHFANSEAIRYFNRAADMCPPAATEILFRILQQREQVYDLTGQRQAQDADIQAMLELAESLGDWHKAESALRQANYADVSGDYQAAINYSRFAMDYAQGSEDLLLQAKANLQLAVALQHLADYSASQSHFEQTIQMIHTAKSTSPALHIIEADSLRGLASIAQLMGEFSLARNYLQQAQTIYLEYGDHRGAARALNILGIIAAESGDLPTAQENFQDALQVFRQIGDPYLENRMILNLSNVAMMMGDYSLAQVELRKALNKTQEIGDLHGRGEILVALGNVYYELGDYHASREYYAQSLVIAELTGSLNDKLLGLNIAFAEHGLGDFVSAEWHLLEAIQISSEIKEPIGEAYDLQELGEIMLDLGRLDEAEEYFKRVIPIRQKIEQDHLNLLPLSGLAWIHLQRGNRSYVQDYIEAALPILAAGEAKGDPGTSLLAYLRLWQALVANQDSRADKILSTAHRYLLDRAARISDESLRQGFIQNIPWHRQITEAYRTLESMGQPDD